VILRKICVVSGSRAEYGLLRNIMKIIYNSESLKLQIIATGMHLSPKFGNTYLDIEKDGFFIDEKVEMLLSSDNASAISKSVGLGTILFSEALMRLQPDIIIILGDRFEVFSCACAALVQRKPIAHLHGGEVTPHLIDEAIRHSLTKISHMHFVATEKYQKRVLQMGEDPDKIFLVGGLGIDNIKNLELLDKNQIENELNISFNKKNLLVTFHPLSLEPDTSKIYVNELLGALNKLEDTMIIFTMPNADTDGRVIFNLIDNFVKNKSNAVSFISLGELKYLSLIQFVDGVLGNSSSGLLEVPTFKKGTINIGDRQKGREKAASVIDCEPKTDKILNALKKLYSKQFQEDLKEVINPYGEGGASKKVVDILSSISIKNIIYKKFHDYDIKLL
jgi:GDP/UDP-N,N'-diacetylbacillosamine 2-epimerase (hydrolysing)